MSASNVTELVRTFADSSPLKREEARLALVSMGQEAVPSLLTALQSDSRQIQYEAAKALHEIRDPKSAEGLARALADNDLDVRWIASDAILHLGKPGLEAMLIRLTQSTDQNFHDTSHRVLSRFKNQYPDAIKPLLEAMKSQTEDTAIMVAASAALNLLRD